MLRKEKLPNNQDTSVERPAQITSATGTSRSTPPENQLVRKTPKPPKNTPKLPPQHVIRHVEKAPRSIIKQEQHYTQLFHGACRSNFPNIPFDNNTEQLQQHAQLISPPLERTMVHHPLVFVRQQVAHNVLFPQVLQNRLSLVDSRVLEQKLQALQDFLGPGFWS